MTVKSIELLNTNLIANSICCLFGLLGTVFGLVTIVALTRSPNLRSRYYLNCGHIALANLISTVATVALCTKRVILTLLQRDEVSTVARCAVDIGSVSFGSNSAIGQNLSLAMDRLMAIVFPLFYSNWYEHHGYVLNCIIWVISLVTTIVHNTAGAAKSVLIPICSKALVHEKWNLILQENLQLLHVATIVLVNCLVLVAAFYRHKKSLTPQQNFKQNRLVKTMTVTVLSDVVIWLLINQILSRSLTSVSLTIALQLFPYNPIVFTLPPILNFICYITLDSEFRKATMKLTAVVHLRSNGIVQQIGLNQR